MCRERVYRSFKNVLIPVDCLLFLWREMDSKGLGSCEGEMLEYAESSWFRKVHRLFLKSRNSSVLSSLTMKHVWGYLISVATKPINQSNNSRVAITWWTILLSNFQLRTSVPSSCCEIWFFRPFCLNPLD